MKTFPNSLRRFDPYAVVAVLLGVLLFSPLFAPGVPAAPDGLLHLYRSALWRWAADAGVWWPRWDTTLYHGWGYPLFNFYAPLWYIVTFVISHLLPSVLVAHKATLLIACIAYPVGMYFWAKDPLGRVGALAAAAAYAFATYRFHALYFQGNYAQFLAWALYPWVLFCYQRLACRPSAAAFFGTVACFSALLLSHNISVMLFVPVAGAYLLYLAIAHRDQRAWLYLGLANLLALSIGLLFWAPALAESGFTRVRVLTQGLFNVQANFLTWRDLVAPTPLLDYRAANPPMPFNFGRLHLVLAALGALVLFKRTSQPGRRWHLALALAGWLLASAMMLSVSSLVWRVIPMLAFAEFPSRMYGIAFLCSSLLVGASLLWFERWPRLSIGIAAILLVGLIVSVAQYQFPRSLIPVSLTPASFLAYEHQYNAPGTTAASEYLSQWTQTLPEGDALSSSLSRTALVDAPSTVSGQVLEQGPESLLLRIRAEVPTEVGVAQFYFPSWRGWLDGFPVALAPCARSGLICVNVPGGQHELRLQIQDTLVSKLSRWLACLAIGLTLLSAALLRRRSGKADPTPSQGWRGALVLGVLILMIMALRFVWIGPRTSLFRLDSSAQAALPAQHKADLPIGPSIKLLGYDIEQDAVHQGDELHVRLYWQATEPPTAEYSSFVQLVSGPDHKRFAGSDAMHPGARPTTLWSPTHYVVDDHRIVVPADTPVGAFKLYVGMYPLGSNDLVGGEDLPGYVHVLPRRPIALASIPCRVDAQFNRDIRLLGYDTRMIGQDLNLILYWQAGKSSDVDYQVFVHVTDANRQVLAQGDSAPASGLYPSSTWLPGQIIADEHRIPLAQGARARDNSDRAVRPEHPPACARYGRRYFVVDGKCSEVGFGWQLPASAPLIFGSAASASQRQSCTVTQKAQLGGEDPLPKSHSPGPFIPRPSLAPTRLARRAAALYYEIRVRSRQEPIEQRKARLRFSRAPGIMGGFGPGRDSCSN